MSPRSGSSIGSPSFSSAISCSFVNSRRLSSPGMPFHVCPADRLESPASANNLSKLDLPAANTTHESNDVQGIKRMGIQLNIARTGFVLPCIQARCHIIGITHCVVNRPKTMSSKAWLLGQRNVSSLPRTNNLVCLRVVRSRVRVPTQHREFQIFVILSIRFRGDVLLQEVLQRGQSNHVSA
jgi:hypothetical protein